MVTANILLVFPQLWNQVFGLVLWVLAEPVDKGSDVEMKH